MDMAYTGLIASIAVIAGPEAQPLVLWLLLCSSLVGPLVARCYKGVVTNYYYYYY